MTNRAAAITALLVGSSLWLLAAMIAGRREAWDSPLYWFVFYPLTIAAAAGLAYQVPDRSWRWALLLFAGQFLAMCLSNGELGGLWPLGMGLFAVLALPAVLAGRLAARARRRSGQAALP